MNTHPAPFGGRAYIILTGDGSKPPALDDIYKPGSISTLIEVEAGGLPAFEADPWVKGSLKNGVPVIAVFDDEADAIALHEKIRRGRH